MGELKGVDIIIIIMVLGLLALCIWNLIRDRKAGVPSCGAKSCASCGMSCTCALGARKKTVDVK